MFGYITEFLGSGFNLPTVLLWVTTLLGLLAIFGRFRNLFRISLILFLVMSLPAIPKWLFSPLDIGALDVSADELAVIDALVVITNGVRLDQDSYYTALSNSSEIRLSRALKVAASDNIPLFVSITDEQERERVRDFVGGSVPLSLIGPSRTTREHMSVIAAALGPMGVRSIILFTTGSHAYRQKMSLQSKGLLVPTVRVGVKDSLIESSDFVPSFKGYFYWQLMLKEYWALLIYKITGEI